MTGGGRDVPVREKPIWRLTSADLDALDPQERQWAMGLLADMKQDGSLAIILANPPGTRFETVWDRQGQAWKMQPLPSAVAQAAIDMIWSMPEEAARLEYFVFNWLQENIDSLPPLHSTQGENRKEGS